LNFILLRSSANLTTAHSIQHTASTAKNQNLKSHLTIIDIDQPLDSRTATPIALASYCIYPPLHCFICRPLPSLADTEREDNTKPSYVAAIDAMDITLQTPFLYQNQSTGQPSSSTLTIRQLCRILCPVSSVASVNNSIISPQTQLLGFDAATNTYDPVGWKCASSIPVLKEACSSWYYESKDKDGGVKGPVSARVLAELFQSEKVDRNTRVFESNRSDGEWKSIRDLSPLSMVIDALMESAMPTSWPADSTANGEQASTMTYDEDEQTDDPTKQEEISKELEAFLSSTDHLANHATQDDEHDEEYESDGGTKYVKDFRTGNWVHEALAPMREKKQNNEPVVPAPKPDVDGSKKRKRNKPKFSAKNSKCWIYVTGLPKDTNEEEVAAYFSKCGVIDLDPETQKPKVKLYRHKADRPEGRTVKGDASICYARAESVELALQILDENLFRDGATLSVTRAKFEQNTDFDENKSKTGKRVISEAKRKVARLAALQAVGWDEGENGRIAGGLKGLRIIVLKNMFDPTDFVNDTNDEKLRSLEQSVHSECEELGTVEKITIFSKNPAGVVIVKFAQPNAASDAVNRFNGQLRDNGKRRVNASYWDGVTDYTVRDEENEAKDAEKRLDEFGDWLENQELPEEFQLRVGEEE
jgi:RNA recognition motif-containing protein